MTSEDAVSSATNRDSELPKDTAGERPWNSYRYLLFYCPEYYPSGGMSDFERGFDDWSEIEAYKASNCWRHMMVADMETNEYWELSDMKAPDRKSVV